MAGALIETTWDEPHAEDPADGATLAELLAGRRVVALTGAGCSTESGIPDYRGPGSRSRAKRPIQYREFVGDPSARARYWARSAVGWRRIAHARPNPAHHALARLEGTGIVSGIITQNVDRLHARAGSRAVVELHGVLARVICLTCGALSPRLELQRRILDLNPLLRGARAAAAPDGDAELDAELDRTFRVPACLDCGGVLKPDVVFFGENVPKERVERAWRLFERADVLLVVGSSLTVFSGYRFVLRAARDGRPVAIVNLGETRGDAQATLKIDGRAGAILPQVAEALGAAPTSGEAR